MRSARSANLFHFVTAPVRERARTPADPAKGRVGKRQRGFAQRGRQGPIRGQTQETRATRFRGPRISRCKMRKTVLSGIVVLLSGAWASAQQAQPGYSFVTSNQKSPGGSAVVVPTAVAPPEPGVLTGSPAAGNW